jgi:twitching motility protein PilT
MEAGAIDERLHQWLSALHGLDGTDILLTHDSKPLLRLDGKLTELAGSEILTGSQIEEIARTHIGDLAGERLKPGEEVDFSFSWDDKARVRVNAYYQRGHCTLSLRRIPMEIPTPQDLGLPESLSDSIRSPSGLILVTGPTGSGKSTSMAAMVDFINRTRPCHIVTVEDPIEYLHQNRVAAISQREVGSDTRSFASALRAVLREDPDVVLVGEMRDIESIAAALTIAETGHLVITTLHTNDSAQAIDRIIDVFPADRRPQIQIQLSSTLLAVLYQRLVVKIGGGMVGAYELMTGIPSVRNLVREGKTRQLRNVVQTHRTDGMQTLEQSLTELLKAGVIDYNTALEASLYPQDIPRPTGQAAPGVQGSNPDLTQTGSAPAPVG